MNTSALNLTRTWFDEHLRQSLDSARTTGHREWFAKSVVIPPIHLVEAFASYEGFAWLFSPADGTAQLGLGLIRDWQWHDVRGVERMELHAEKLLAQGLPDDTVVVGGQGFQSASDWNGWPHVYLALPMVQLVQSNEETVLKVVMAVDGEQPPEFYHRKLEPVWRALFHDPGPASMPIARPARIEAVPSRETWMQMVAEAAQDIQAGRMDKVVLARALEMSYANRVPLQPLLNNLRNQNPEATVFALRYDGSTFLGATPEQLARVQGTLVDTMSLAGSAPRGMTPEEDYQLAERMKNDLKTMREHALVKRHVLEALGDMTDSLYAPESPDLKKLPSVQHLLTPVRGSLKPGASIWSVVKKLHPTPAVAGHPVDAATQYLNQHEPFRRGWYAGSVGWANLAGNGQWVVSLRSGLVRHTQVKLFAGCGILGDSDPQAELLESDWKFNTMLSALEIEGDSW